MANMIGRLLVDVDVPKYTKISSRADLFIERYVISRHGKQAAIDAGYSSKTAESQASRLLSNVKVRAEIDRRIAKISEEAKVQATDVVKEIARIVFSDVRKVFGPEGTLKPISEIDDDTASAISAVEVEALFEGKGKDRKQIGHMYKIKLWDKNAAAEKLMRYLGMYEKNEVERKDGLAELLALIQSRNVRLPIKK